MDYTSRIEGLRKRMEEKGIDKAVLFSDDHNSNSAWRNFWYFTGFDDFWRNFLFIDSESAVLYTNSPALAKESCPFLEVKKISIKDMKSCINRSKNISADFFAPHDIFSKLFSSRAPSDISPEISKMRSIKSHEEISLIRTACRASDEVMKHLREVVKPGLTEARVAREIKMKVLEMGMAPDEPIVASSSDSANPHFIPGERVLKKGDPILIDMGAVNGEYHSDCTRMFTLGRPSREFSDAFDSVLDMLRFCEKGISSSLSCSELSMSLKNHFDSSSGSLKSGYFDHALGHGIGLAIHEPPAMHEKSEDTFMDGMAFAVEPALYFRKKFGIRLEDSFALEDDVLKRLTSFPRELVVL